MKDLSSIEVYADNAATTKISKKALLAMNHAYEHYFANPSSDHPQGRKALEALEDSRAKIASLVYAQSKKEIYFTSGGSEADNQALWTIAHLGEISGKKHIISSKFEHHAVLNTLDKIKEKGFDITLIDIPKDGIIDPKAILEAIRPNTIGISIMYANNEIGTIQPIQEIGEICRRYGIIFHTDAVQAVGHLKINVTKENIDLLSASSHKFNGPRGVGFLYAREGIKPIKLIEGGNQEFGVRAGTENLPAIIGMCVALENSLNSLAISNLRNIRDRIIDGLINSNLHIILNGNREKRLPSNINLSIKGCDSTSIRYLCNEKNIAISAGSACNSAEKGPSYVLKAIGVPDDYINGSIRLSIADDLTLEQENYLVNSLLEIIKSLTEEKSLF